MNKIQIISKPSDSNLKKEQLLLTVIITTYLSLNNRILSFLKHNHLDLQVHS